MVEKHLVKTGPVGRAQVCVDIGKSDRTLGRWLEQGIPTAHHAYKLALACGCSEKEALRMAREEALAGLDEETA